jgi:release factor glutamine methyltransferase
MQTVSGALSQAQGLLTGLPGSSRLDAELLLAHVLGVGRTRLHAFPEDVLTSEQMEGFLALCNRRSLGVSVAYLLGEAAFWGRPFKVSEHTLVPRPETESLLAFMLAHQGVKDRSELPLSVVDLGTGSGVIAITLALERPVWQVLGVDIDEGTLAVARGNASDLGARVAWLAQDGLLGLADVDVIVSNPPYIAQGDSHLQGDGVCHEPVHALVGGGDDGLSFISRMIMEARGVLKPGGWLFFEHGYDQGGSVMLMLEEQGFVAVGHGADDAGYQRFAVACWLGEGGGC